MYSPTKDYFEGILQIRSEDVELLNWIHKRIKLDRKAAVAKEKKVTNGVDLYMSDQHYLQNLGKKISIQFPGILKISKRLHTMNKMTSRHVYRVTVYFKPYPFKHGDTLSVQGESLKILSLGNRVQVKNLQTGEKKFIPLEILLRNR